MKKLYSTRSVVNSKSELVPSEIRLTNAVVKHKLNKHLNLSAGWHLLEGVDCTQPPPQPPKGEFGYYSCISGQWVFFPV